MLGVHDCINFLTVILANWVLPLLMFFFCTRALRANTVNARVQNCYAAALVERGVKPCRIHRFGIAFRGQEVLVGEG